LVGGVQHQASGQRILNPRSQRAGTDALRVSERGLRLLHLQKAARQVEPERHGDGSLATASPSQRGQG